MFKAIKQLSVVVFSAILSIVGILIWRKISMVRRQLTYKEVISYFVKNKPPLTSKGVLIRKSEFGGIYMISQKFLDNKDQIVMKPNGLPYGRDIRVVLLDDELSEAFGSKDVVVFT